VGLRHGARACTSLFRTRRPLVHRLARGQPTLPRSLGRSLGSPSSNHIWTRNGGSRATASQNGRRTGLLAVHRCRAAAWASVSRARCPSLDQIESTRLRRHGQTADTTRSQSSRQVRVVGLRRRRPKRYKSPNLLVLVLDWTGSGPSSAWRLSATGGHMRVLRSMPLQARAQRSFATETGAVMPVNCKRR
jgi:hypothetical protein